MKAVLFLRDFALRRGRSGPSAKERPMSYLSDTNLRAVLIVLLERCGGTVDLTNGELYDAMLPDRSGGERFQITQTDGGVRISIVPSRPEQSASN
jgi:hypothetical protein